MSRKTFSGTVNIDGTPYVVSGDLTRDRFFVRGALCFAADPTRAIPLSYQVSGNSLIQSGDSYFSTPASAKIVVTAFIDSALSSIDTDFTTITLTDIPIIVDGLAGRVMSATWAVQDTSSVASIASPSDNWTTDSTSTRRAPTTLRANEVGNTFDHFGAIVSLERLPGESNIDYLARIRSATRQRGGADYKGMVNGISRLLGLVQSESIKVTAKSSANMQEVALVIDANKARIYSKWIPKAEQRSGHLPTIEQEIELAGQTIGSLSEWINKSEAYSSVVLANAQRSASQVILREPWALKEETYFGQEVLPLSEENILRGYFLFGQKDQLSNEVASASEVVSFGDWYLDADGGIFHSYETFQGQLEVSYLYNESEFFLYTVPFRITDLSSDSAHELYFEQLEKNIYDSEEDKFVNGLPTNEMYGIIRDVLTAGNFAQLWGD